MNQKLSFGIKVKYGIADLGFALITSAIQFFLLFYYTDVAGINSALAGFAYALGKVTWDAFNDPLFGYLSDRTRSRFGRRRIYMLIGAVPLGIAFWIMFSLPKGLSGVAAFLVVLFSFLLVDTFQTMTSTPYYALTPELTRDYNERASLTSVRMIFSVIGYILGAGFTSALAAIFKGAGFNLQQAWSITGAVFGLIAILTTLFTTLTIKEKPELAGEPSKIPPIKAILTSFKNKPFNILMLAFLLSSFSFTLLTTLAAYFITYQLNMRNSVSSVISLMIITIGVFIVPARMLSDRINKGPTYALGLFIASIAIISSFFFPHQPTKLIYIVSIVAGIGFSTQWVCPWSMLPDVVEYDEKLTGERREGIYYGLWAFLSKYTGALGLLAAGLALNPFGYIPDIEQTAHALLGIRLFFSIVPAVVILISLPLLIWYPITRQSHAALVKELAERRAAESLEVL